MGCYILPAPGTKTGPCVAPCDHKDCAETRKLAAAPCFHCGRAIGYDVKMHFLGKDDDGNHRLAHLTCPGEVRPGVRVDAVA
ncbi:hypothetical protein HY633_01440 [Candidatus Uhrbacteria bacterium]|nr:hypothetical protein [Candidatus Uhrbacteria bacterium]